MDGRAITIHDIRVPMFAVGTERDHVAPWRSVFKLHLLADADITFVLTNGGHNAGVLSEPGHEHRHFRMAVHRHGEQYVDPESWVASNPPRDGILVAGLERMARRKIRLASRAASAGPAAWQVRGATGCPRQLRPDEIRLACNRRCY